MQPDETRPQDQGSGKPAAVAHYGITIFLSSFLLFQIQPIIARHILPWFGGGPGVWTTCMVFFQSLLLVGYGYAHTVCRTRKNTQAIIHLGLLAASLLLLRVGPSESWKPGAAENPIPLIIALLAATIGAPYLLVASTGPLLQRWFAETNPGHSPYRLFALSNVGSLLGLLAYPFAIEPLFTLHTQAQFWGIGYVIFVLLSGWCAFRLFRSEAREPTTEADSPDDQPAPAWTTRLLCLALAACGSLMLLATTNQMCQDVAVIPLLWILPLSLYLISFIICFDRESWYQRRIWLPLLAVSIPCVVVLLFYNVGDDAPILTQIAVYSLGMFVCCMVCHGEMARLKPAPRYLTSFYLLVATGGAAGSIFVGLVAPNLFAGFWEFHLGLLLTPILAGVCITQGRVTFDRVAWGAGWGVAMAVLAFSLHTHTRRVHLEPIDSARNFYGVLRVYAHNLRHPGQRGRGIPYRSLYHGQVLHGSQLLGPRMREIPTTYYGRESGIGLAVRFHPARVTGRDGSAGEGLEIGVVGLGAGTIAALAGKNDEIRFYEINPEVVRLCRRHFSYLEDSEARATIVVGDARIRLEQELAQEGPRQFDVLALDAFTADAIPVHLLTREAFELYFQHLKPDGILAVHVSNKHLEFGHVLKALAAEFDKLRIKVVNAEAEQGHVDSSDWVLITSNRELLSDRRFTQAADEESWRLMREILWTDDYSNLFDLIE